MAAFITLGAGKAMGMYTALQIFAKGLEVFGYRRNVTQAAENACFSSDTQLRRAWHQFGLDGTPAARA